MNDVSVLAIIPARGGSKGLKKKNLALLNGHPLVAYGICSAKSAKHITKVVVSTDDDEIANVSEKYGAEVIFRPSEFATDESATEPCMQHVVEVLEKKHSFSAELISLIQCTSPFRLARDIDESVELLIKHDADSLMSVSETPGHFHPYWQKQITEDGFLSSIYEEPEVGNRILEVKKYWRRQDLPGVYYWKNGAVYTMKRSTLMVDGNRYGENCIPLVIPSERLVNIDGQEDLDYAEFLFQKKRVSLDFNLNLN